MEKQLIDLFVELFKFTGIRDLNLLMEISKAGDRVDQGNVIFRLFFWLYPILLSIFPDLNQTLEPLQFNNP